MLLDLIVWLPLVLGLVLMIIPENLKPFKISIALFVGVLTLISSTMLYLGQQITLVTDSVVYLQLNRMFGDLTGNFFRIDPLSELIVLGIGFFSFLILIYSAVFVKKEDGVQNYFAYILMTLGASNGAALADHLLVFLVFWSLLAILLYLLIPSGTQKSSDAAVKSLVIIGASDVIMLFGIAIIWAEKNVLAMSELSFSTDSWHGNLAFIALLIGAFTKAGAFPFHSWIPDFTKEAPESSSAYLPASLDKLLGIYFMARLCNELFILNQWLRLTIIIIGVTTIIIAVMMALIQHDYRKLLGYHAVSQVGYMVTGLGLGTALGIIGGLFHMVNHALYKSGLFLVAGSVGKQTGQHQINRLGGLSKKMPITFVTALIFALAISGIPPLNGFASKWIIYQAIIDFGKGVGVASDLWMIWLALAVVGSALTLASFIKFISGIFLGREQKENPGVKESGLFMTGPMIILALFCIAFGVFATYHVVPYLFGEIVGEAVYLGIWDSAITSILILASILIGLLIYAVGNVGNFRISDSFIGGERLQEKTGFAPTDFYQTISHTQPFAFIYDKAIHGWFDIYVVSKHGVLKISHFLKSTHTGILQTYAFWLIMGLILMMILLLIF